MAGEEGREMQMGERVKKRRERQGRGKKEWSGKHRIQKKK